jgi:transcriptional regulator with GAF, ATPase, and Fis domain
VTSGEHDVERQGRLAQEQTVPALLGTTAELLVEQLSAMACTISRAIGDLLVDLVDHSAGGPVQAAHSYLISDFPLTQAVLDNGEPKRVWIDDAEADPEEAALMRRLGFDSLLLLRLDCDAKPWGLIEVYDNRSGGFAEEQLEAAQRIVESASLELSRLSSR